MTRHIDTATLRDWLEQDRPVTVLDIRNDEDRSQWAIPGSLHINAYDALRKGEPGPLQTAVLPQDRPVVTVCNAGRMSEKAADVLSERGIDVLSLAGGMKAWSVAWNSAEVPLTDAATRVIQIRRTGKGCLSYLVISNGEAAVIDASLDSDVYANLAAQHGGPIRWVLETHIHADHLSRARQLADEHGARLVLPAQNRARFPFKAISEGEQVLVGAATLTALHTPGHTDESMAYLLNGEVLFSGDTLFVNGVGRPDLHAGADGARARTRALFHSLTRLRALPPQVVVLPAHTGQPVAFDGRPIQARISEIEQWLSRWLVSEDSFIERVTSRIPATPPNFAAIVGLNEAGERTDGDPTELEAGANRCAIS
jgi:glyoxylase-like metal-dependent hydrolase (beta-lactamase superfamily II)/rhodanese-related sulfurtransferase